MRGSSHPLARSSETRVTLRMLAGVCANCAMGATVAAAGATGMRAWLATRLGPRALRAASAFLVGGGLVAASVAFS